MWNQMLKVFLNICANFELNVGKYKYLPVEFAGLRYVREVLVGNVSGDKWVITVGGTIDAGLELH